MKCKKCKGVSGGVEGQKNKITVMENLPGRKKNEQNMKYKKYKGIWQWGEGYK